MSMARSSVAIVNGRVYAMDRDEVSSFASCVVVEDGLISYVGNSLPPLAPSVPVVDAKGGAILPGLIDAHTHLVFAGDRIAEFALKSRGATYQEIAAAGGGIWRTVQATRAASEDELFGLALRRIRAMARRGVLTVEGKSGYGLREEDELKILRVCRRLAAETGLDVVTTFLAAHVVPKDYPLGVDSYVADSLQWLRHAHRQGLVDGVDMFVEQNAFGPEHARQLAVVARELGLPLRLHVDQLRDGQGASLAAELSALSADHLEHMGANDAKLLAAASVVATLVPFATLLVGRGAKPPVLALRAAGAKFCVATDFNPGSAPAADLLYAGFLAVADLKLTVDEVLLGVTRYAAQALGLAKTHGTLEVGKVGDVIVLEHAEPASLFYELSAGQSLRFICKRGVSLPTASAS